MPDLPDADNPRLERRLGEAVGVAIDWLEDAGHVNTPSGYGPWATVQEWRSASVNGRCSARSAVSPGGEIRGQLDGDRDHGKNRGHDDDDDD